MTPTNTSSVTADSIFSGITTFARLPWVQCLGKHSDEAFDIAFIGAPFVCLACASYINVPADGFVRRTLGHHTAQVLGSGPPAFARALVA